MKFLRQSLLLITVLFSLLPAVSPAQTPEDTARPKIHIGPGDLIEVKIFGAPDFSQTARVDDVGDATIIFIGKIHFAGLTTEESQTLIAKKYQDGDFFLHPEVSVLIREYSTQGVSILGEVAKPGVYPVLGNLTLLDIISEAGGTNPAAGDQVTIRRRFDGSTLTVNLPRNARPSFASDDVEIQPGDKIFVPRAGIVYVLGDVKQPGGYVMQNQGRISLLQALAMAAGANSTASLNRARLIHKTSSGYQDIAVALKDILKGHEDDWQMQAEDILYIPNSAAKSILYRGLPIILESATNAAIYRVP